MNTPSSHDGLEGTVTIQQAMHLAQVSRRTIYNWLDLGKIHGVRTAGGSMRIYEDTLWHADISRAQPVAEP